MCVLRHAHLRLHRRLLLLVQHPLVSRLVPAAVLLVLLEQFVHLVVATHVRRVLQLSPRDHSHLVLLLEDHAALGTHCVVAVVLRLLLHVMQQLTALRHQRVQIVPVAEHVHLRRRRRVFGRLRHHRVHRLHADQLVLLRLIPHHLLHEVEVRSHGLRVREGNGSYRIHDAVQKLLVDRELGIQIVVVAQLANILVVHVVGYAIERRLRRTRRYLLARKVPVKTVVETLLPNGLKGVCVLTGGTDAFLLVSSLGHTHDNVVDYVLGKGPLSRPDTDDATQLASHFIVCLFFADIEQYRTDSK